MPKSSSSVKSEAAQPLLRGINLARFLCDRCPFDRMKSKPKDFEGVLAAAGVVRPAPSSVPPDSNTGVHHEPSNRGAATSERSE